jgi:hypothetical protein
VDGIMLLKEDHKATSGLTAPGDPLALMAAV